jgi:queuine tRNA-ribosyltransferase
MRIISFENDLDSLKLAVQRNDLFPYLRHGGPPALLQAGEWQSKQHIGLSWVLQRGDFLEMMRHVPAPPDLIFYDMFSSKTSSGVWGLEAFRQISGACAGRAAELYTYSCATSARVALLAAGFYIAQGRSIGPKAETTIALTPEAYRARWVDREEVLSAAWLTRWDRSGAKFPAGLPVEAHPAFENSIRQHPQFQRPCLSGVES